MINKTVDFLHSTGMFKGRQSHLKSRLIVSLLLLCLSIFGVLLTDFAPDRVAWKYWVYVTPVYALICIILSYIVSRKHDVSMVVIWHEILHWIGLLCGVYIVSLIIGSGIISFLIGGIFVLTLLALTMFLAGVHFDSMYLIIGIILGILVVVQTLLVKYLTFILIPLIVIVAIIFIWRYRHAKKAGMETRRASSATKKSHSDGEDEL